VLFLGNASSKQVRAAMADGLIGQMCTPAERRLPIEGAAWAADNGVFGKGYPGDVKWWAWLQSLAPHADRCLFAVAPDVVGDHAATLERSLPWMARIRALGYPVAFVLQNGADVDGVPWDEFDVAFIGGDDSFKLGLQAAELAREARRRGKRVHMGRVNGPRRYAYAKALGCDTVDGTFLAFGPDVNLLEVLSWPALPLQEVLA
jgi:hypothetical protein